jgi:eukaryotic-like serine/threonine-protein kinase
MLGALVAVAFIHLWTHVDRGWFLATPTVAQGVVYEGTTIGDVLALHESDGRVRWRATLGANPDETYGNPRGVISSVALSNGVAYAVSGSCAAGAFDALTGRALWRRRICSIAKNDDTYASPVVADGRVLYGINVIGDRPTDTGREVALDAATGRQAWSFTPVRYGGTGGGISTTPLFDPEEDVAILGTGNPTPMSSPPAGPDPYTDSVIAVEPGTGRWRWVTGPLIPHDANDFDVFASPRLVQLHARGRTVSAVFAIIKNARAVMLDERTGAILWQRALEPAMHWMQAIGTPAVEDGTIVVPLFRSPQTGELVALRAQDGKVLWRAQTPGIYEAPVIWRGIIFAAEARGAVSAFDMRTGIRVGRLRVASPLYGHGLALDGDMLLVAGRGALWAYRIER